jgi:hypothetical protein
LEFGGADRAALLSASASLTGDRNSVVMVQRRFCLRIPTKSAACKRIMLLALSYRLKPAGDSDDPGHLLRHVLVSSHSEALAFEREPGRTLARDIGDPTLADRHCPFLPGFGSFVDSGGAGLLGAPLSQLGPGDHGRADATGANSVTNAVPIGSTPPMPMPADSKNDPKPGKKTGTADAPCFQRVVSLFSLCYLLLEKSSNQGELSDGNSGRFP